MGAGVEALYPESQCSDSNDHELLLQAARSRPSAVLAVRQTTGPVKDSIFYFSYRTAKYLSRSHSVSCTR